MNSFSLFLFTTKDDLIAEADRSGISGIIVDWENKGKTSRQASADTQINYDSVEDLRRVRTLTDKLVICRINGYDNVHTFRKEIETAVTAGADEILIPMVRTVEEVKLAMNFVNGRCGISILIETMEAVRLSGRLGELPLARVYVGLNDLAIDRGINNIFDSLADGTVEDIRKNIKAPFGFAGLTLPDRGRPVPCSLLISEMARLKCAHGFLRRSFLSDIRGRDMSVEVSAIHNAVVEAFQYSDEEKNANTLKLKKIIKEYANLSVKKF